VIGRCGFDSPTALEFGKIIHSCEPRKRWIEDVEEDTQIMGIRGWRKLCKEREEWKKITGKAKTRSGL